jgi:hypothetical protein
MKLIQIKAPTWMQVKSYVSQDLGIPDEQASYLLWKTDIERRFYRFVTEKADIDFYNLFSQFMMDNDYENTGKYRKILDARKATGKPFKTHNKKKVISNK